MRLSCAIAPVLVVAAAANAACVPTAKPPPGEEARQGFTAQLTDGHVLPHLAALSTASTTLVEAVAAWRATPSDENLTTAQNQWRATMDIWQRLEVVHLGPAGQPTAFTGGLGLRDRIYAWPQFNACGVDQQVVRNEFGDDTFADSRLVNVLGLGTLEYLLFVSNDDNACPGSAAINRNGEWDAVAVDERHRRKAHYADVVARDVAFQVSLLEGAWRDGYAESLRTAGDEGSPFPSAQHALDEVYAALFYVELIAKDRKLAVPAGLHIDCDADVCPNLTESPFAAHSLANLRNNLAGVRAVFTGDVDASVASQAENASGVGLADLLVDAGHTDAATTMTASLDAAIDATGSFSGTIEASLTQSPDQTRALHAALKAFTDDYKGTLPSLLGTRVPDEGAGDND